MADVTVNLESTDPKELLGQGIRAYILQDYNNAVQTLSKASELLVKEHDEHHDSLGEVYLYYGKSLLGLSRDETEALGDAVPKNVEDSDSGEEADEAEPEENGDTHTTADQDEKEVETETDKTAEENDKTEIEESGSSQNEDEPTDLQLAWEVLELAKTIFEKRGDAGKKYYADAVISLGEISLESENFETAINDLKQGLEIQKEIFLKDSRTVAETLYKLAIAYSTNSQIDEAIQYFTESIECLKGRIKILSESKDDGSEEEIKEIEGLIPDIQERITDMKSYKDETLKKIVSAVMDPKPTATNGSGSSSSVTAAASSSSLLSNSSATSTAKQANDISHLVKRKRKVDEESATITSENVQPAKKPSP